MVNRWTGNKSLFRDFPNGELGTVIANFYEHISNLKGQGSKICPGILDEQKLVSEDNQEMRSGCSPTICFGGKLIRKFLPGLSIRNKDTTLGTYSKHR